MDFVAIDFETAKHSMESACAVGLVKYLGDEKVDFFYSLIRPQVLYIRPDFTEIHGITVDDVRDAPDFVQLWDSAVKPFIGSLPLVAHNACFDMTVLRSVLDWYELDVPEYEYFDSLAVARRVWPEFRNHKLTFLGEQFGIEYQAHNALADAETCARVIFRAAGKILCNTKSAAHDIPVTALLDACGLTMKTL
ncbi:MAG: 3'-5' exonuclease [Treponema sp.]|nr:3'-5' exonuclease [Treponema sp.]